MPYYSSMITYLFLGELSCSFLEVNVSLTQYSVSVSPAYSLNGGHGVQDANISINVRVEHTKNVLKLLWHQQSLQSQTKQMLQQQSRLTTYVRKEVGSKVNILTSMIMTEVYPDLSCSVLLYCPSQNLSQVYLKELSSDMNASDNNI